jgi:hypothetical protein
MSSTLMLPDISEFSTLHDEDIKRAYRPELDLRIVRKDLQSAVQILAQRDVVQMRPSGWFAQTPPFMPVLIH